MFALAKGEEGVKTFAGQLVCRAVRYPGGTVARGLVLRRLDVVYFFLSSFSTTPRFGAWGRHIEMQTDRDGEREREDEMRKKNLHCDRSHLFRFHFFLFFFSIFQAASHALRILLLLLLLLLLLRFFSALNHRFVVRRTNTNEFGRNSNSLAAHQQRCRRCA